MVLPGLRRGRKRGGEVMNGLRYIVCQSDSIWAAFHDKDEASDFARLLAEKWSTDAIVKDTLDEYAIVDAWPAVWPKAVRS